MMRQQLERLTVQTGGRGFYDITAQVQDQVTTSRLRTGLCTLHLQHTSASLLIQENADPDVRRDFETFFAKLVPDGDRMFIHTAEGEDDMPAHIRAALTTVNLSVPFDTSRLVLGMWQGIYVWEHRREAHRRVVVCHVLGE
jgi:secondary thiamine-phosphate synthase enzyme